MAEGLVLEEQRRLVRRELIYYLQITDRQSGVELGRLVDVNTGGMLMMSEKPLTVGELHEVDLALPKGLQKERKCLPVKIEVVWSRRGPRVSTYYDNGVRFLDLDPDLVPFIERLVAICAMPKT